MRRATAIAIVLLLAAAPAAAGERLAVLPLRNTGPAAPQLAWLEREAPVYLASLIAAEAGLEVLDPARAAAVEAAWGPADAPPSPAARRLLAESGARAVLTGSFQSQAGSLRLQAELYRDAAADADPLRISLSGKLAQVTAALSSLAEVAAEALTGRFPRVLRPPLPSPPQFLLAAMEPSFGPRSPDENLAQSETFLLTALKIDPNNADAYAQLGVLYARHGLDEKALANLTTAVELSPKSPRHHWNLGVELYRRGQLEEALTEFLQSTVTDEGFVDGFVALGALHRRLDDREASQAALEKAVKAGPENPRALVALGVHQYLAKDPAGARALFEKARAIDQRSVAASVNLALLAWEGGDLETARKDLERALAAESANPEALANLAVIESERGAPEAAIARLQAAIEAGAPKEAALYNVGAAHLAAGNLAEAELAFRRVLDLAPANEAARTNVGFVQLLRGRAAEAAATFGAERSDSAASALSSYNLALTHQLARNAQQALVHYLRALQARRDLTAAHVNLGILFEGMGRPEKALTEYLKALSADESIPEVYTWLGQVYAQRGYGSMAEETIRKTTLVNPALPGAWHALATALEPGDPQKAAAAWGQFLEAVRRDRNRAFWVPVAEARLAALGGR